MYFRSEGVILAKKNFGEADRILTIYTKDHGKVTVLAKGVRRPRSRKGGHVELGNWCKLFIARGKNLDLLTEVELKRAFGIAAFSEEKANQIYHLLELVDALTAHHQKNLQVFILLVHFLKKIASGEDFNLVSSTFKVKLLSTLGFFSSKNLKDSHSQKLLEYLEEQDFESIRKRVKLTKSSYLKLLRFLDSIVENVIQAKLTTSKFLTNEVPIESDLMG